MTAPGNIEHSDPMRDPFIRVACAEMIAPSPISTSDSITENGPIETLFPIRASGATLAKGCMSTDIYSRS
jgi:hypothetical protein